MAKATYHRHQRVYVEPVGTWAVIDKVNPVWVKGFDEPAAFCSGELSRKVTFGFQYLLQVLFG